MAEKFSMETIEPSKPDLNVHIPSKSQRRAERRQKAQEAQDAHREREEERRSYALMAMRGEAERIVSLCAEVEGFNLSTVHRGFMIKVVEEVFKYMGEEYGR